MSGIAVVGMGCRLPGGVHRPREYWDFLLRKGDGMVEVPPDRWNLDLFYDSDVDAPGRMYTRRGGFLTDPVWDFDADFFGISRREASVMDPQQRLILEVAWEALDDAGMAGRVAGGDAGVYIGGFMSDNQVRRHMPQARLGIDAHTSTSGTFTMLSNRLSYVLDLHGPSMTIDTACSSSLVAVHEAVQSLLRGECGVALAGGVNVMLHPETFVSMCKGRFLSPDGRCKAFDASADGYARGEGAGVVVLKPVEAAVRDGDRIYAVILATGSNQDGRTPGITVPNGQAQARLARQVCERAGVEPSDIGYLEAHGTGTAIGDPVEMAAMGQALGAVAGRRSPLVVGSVKAGIGHLEAAAGIAGLIKAALTVHHRTMVPQAWLQNLNPAIPFADLGLRVATEVETFPADAEAYAAVNGFGYGGTNAHAVLGQAPVQALAPAGGDAVRLLPVSGTTAGAVAELAGALAQAVTDAGGNPGPVRDAAWVRRAHHPVRTAVAYHDAADLAAKLRALAAGGGKDASRTIVPSGTRPVFVFSGMGPQWWGMSRGLLQGGGAFAAKAHEIDTEFTRIAGWSIVAELLRGEAESRVTRTEIAQPATFLLQVGLAAELASLGVNPAAAVGHSVGEVAAAYVSGALGLHDALLVSHHRSQLQASLAGAGGMLAVGLPEAEAQSWLGTDGIVCVAAVNSPSAVTLAGPTAALEELAGRLHTAGIFTRILQVNVPYHSALMNPMLAPLVSALGPLRPAVPTVPLYSTVSASQVKEALLDASYWSENVRRPVRFSDTVGALLRDGHRVFLELGPHPVLGGNIREILLRAGEPGTVVRTLVRRQDDADSLVRCLAELYSAGCLDGSQVPGGTGSAVAHVDLPAYPWQREHLWVEDPAVARMRLGEPRTTPLLGRRLDGSAPEWEAEISATTLPWLRDHVVDGAVVLPGAAFLDAVLSAARRPGQGGVAVEGVEFASPLVIDEHDVPALRVAVEEATGRFTVRSRSAAAEDWTVHVTGRIIGAPADPESAAVPPVEDGRPMDGADLYDRLGRRGLAYGPAFRRISQAVVGTDGVSAVLDAEDSGDGRHLCHPAVLDAALQCVAALFTAEESGRRTAVVPFRVASARWFAPFPPTVEAHVRRRKGPGLHADVRICDPTGTVLVELGDVEFRPLAPPLPVITELDRLFYETAWEKTEAADDGGLAQGPALIIDLGPRGSARAAQLAAAYPDTAFLSARDGQVTALHVTKALLDTIHDPDRTRLTVIAVAGDTSPHDPVAEGVDQVALLTEAAQGVSTALAEITERADSAKEVEATGADAAFLVDRAGAVRGIVLTEGAFRLPDDPRGPNLAHAALVGARRSLRNEQPGVRWRLVDAEPGSPLAAVEAALSRGGAADQDDELCLRQGLWFAPRLRRTLADHVRHLATAVTSAEADASYVLEVPESGGFADLAFRSCERSTPGIGEVELRLDTIGLNYKDSMKVLAVRTADELEHTYFGATIGMEGGGVVTRVGPGVKEFKAGDRVFAMERDMFRRFLTMRVDSGFLSKIPDSLKLEYCTSMSPLITAHYGLVRAARLTAGETVLIHGAAGGVGLAAVQVAVALGARVIGSASTEERREAVLAAGADHVVNSRSVNFVADVLRMTNGQGADVILNSAPGEIMRQNLNAAAEFGRIVEVGKTDIYAGGVIDLRPFDRNLSFTAIDMDRLMRLRPEVFIAIATEVLDRLAGGTYRPLPVTVRPAAELPDAFEAVARARCIGRIAVALSEGTEVLPPQPVFRAHCDGTYLITGGFGALGLATARRLASLGARHLVLVSRSGAASSTAQEQVRRLRAAGVEVIEERADVGVRVQVAELVARLSRTGPLIRGVFHTAGVSETRSRTRSSAESLRRVAHAKALGAWNLHTVLDEAGIDVDAFVLYSSMSALVGPAAQVGYTAANTVLDALAALRHWQGKPALSINWGSLSGGGMAEESIEVERFLEHLGFRPIDMERAAAMLAECLVLEPRSPQVAVADMNWAAWAAANPGSTDILRLSEPVAAARSGAADARSLREELRALPDDQRAEVVAYILAEQLATVLGVAADTVELGVPLHDLGMDSLMGVEFTTRVLVALGMEISAVELGGSGGLRELSGRISRRLGRADHSRRQ